jgi:glycosyltransferase involved in cell wall biosynthesis
LKFLLLNQTFYPDVMATGQYLQELALELVRRGHEVTVVTSRRAYDHPEKRFPKSETWRGIRIHRVGATGFGKTAKWRRASDFATFMFCCAARLAFMPRPDAIIALTSPPLISFLGACLAKFHRCRFFYWVMDFNPDQAIAAGWLRPNSLAGKLLERMSRFSLRAAAKVIVLDRFMRDRITAKGVAPGNISVSPLWAREGEVRFDETERNRFREEQGIAGKFVVMHAGNHSPCHPLETLLQAARQLRHDPNIIFCFIGGGSEFRKLQQLTVNGQETANIRCLPYRPLSELSAVLSSADLHVVVMGDPFVGIVHPCKIYNVLSVAAPMLYIGPNPSHVTDLIDSMKNGHFCAAARHGDVNRVVSEIERARKCADNNNRQVPQSLMSRHSIGTALPNLAAVLESI